MRHLSWVITAGGSLIGGLVALAAIVNSVSAVQEAAGATIGLAFAIIPYCFARAITEMNK